MFNRKVLQAADEGKDNRPDLCRSSIACYKNIYNQGQCLTSVYIHQGHVLMSMALLPVLLILSSQLYLDTYSDGSKVVGLLTA